jgi:capsular exopolysaccharide synthesis family protein
MMEGFGLSSAMRSLENQMAILSSWSTMRQTIAELNFNISYFKTGRVKSSEMYGNTPFTVQYDPFVPQLTNIDIYLSVIDAETFKLTYSTEEADYYIYNKQSQAGSTGAINYEETHHFGEWLDIPGMHIMIENNSLSQPEEKGYYFHFNNPDVLAAEYQRNFKSIRSNENTSIVKLSLTGKNSAKNIDFLNKLAAVFIRNNLDKKNQIATNTIDFIEEQLIIISDSLSDKGTELSHFRTSNQIQSVPAQAELLFGKLEQLAGQTSQIKLEKNYYQYLSTYFSDDSLFNQNLAPASYPIENSAVITQITHLIELSMEFQTLIKEQGSEETANPYILDLKAQMEIAKQTLIKAIYNQIAMINRELLRITNEEHEITTELYQLPEKERQLFGIEREFSLNNEVYTFLLRKRSEAQIQKASNTPDHTVLEKARYAGQIYPIEASDRQKALLVGLFLPFFFLIGKQILNNKIGGTDDVERLTDLPIIGNVIHNNKELSNVVFNNPKSVITEAFRRVRARLEYFTSEKQCPVIAISSSMPGEGKTFCALNIASVFAISGKKTLLMGFDLRKPGLNKVLNIPKHNNGISNYLIGQAMLEDVIQPHDDLPYLFILPSGTIPPNPSELIGSHKTTEMLNQLKQQFEIIILDTPPMGIVSDAYLLARHADSMVFLSRQNFTVRSVFTNTIKQMKDEGICNIGILLNDIPVKKSVFGYNYYYGSKYGYGYGVYGNNHGYYED